MSTVDTATATNQHVDLGSKSAGRAAKDKVAQAVMWLAFVIAMIPLVWILATVIVKGGSLLLESQWWTHSQQGITNRREGGGAVHAIQGTLLQGFVTALISVPIGVFTAVYLVEYGRGKLARAVSFMVDILTGIPSVVAALFIYALWVTTFGFNRIPFAVCLALTILMVPTIVRSTEEMLKLVPNELREASYALGVPKWKTIVKIVLPTAFSGIVTGILLGLARVMGETAPLIILAPYFRSISTNLFDGLMGTLPTMINDGRDNMGLVPTQERVWAASLTLILLILVLNLLGRLVSRMSKVKS
ncbi:MULTISPECIES: phosphate ABC transporter permease PstA [unclassified Yimella]|uniref:phosphate ABC transporter permease PstA n=1 Tax=unclassified Yimella TaxID=2649892 RepID=UPI00101DE942|nr:MULTISPECIES: phosphate ABC transporter permease PstA [unclassified Yimella]MCG8654344.1 phosphate ABC transporter permease PstA [Yimella sp. NH-Cas1]RYG78239.1 phosphate ABC transporter permease PstA [Yimella sp. RIT 621]